MVLKTLVILWTAAFLLLTVYGGEQKSANSFEETRELVVLRKIGHELLLSSGDKHSRVLPLKKVSDNEYHLFFESRQAISTDSFMQVVHEVIRKHELPTDLTANILTCAKQEIVYSSYIAPTDDKDITPCLGRPLPEDCYYISFIFPSDRTAGLSKAWYAGGALLSLSALFYVFWVRRKKQQPVIPAPQAKKDEDLVTLGKFRFHPQQQYLLFDEVRTALTSKETKLLVLLAASPNIVIDRSTLQKEIWENEGVIVTRSLDMFVSKLRKKLSQDSSLRIVNVHGVGYKLEWTEM